MAQKEENGKSGLVKQSFHAVSLAILSLLLPLSFLLLARLNSPPTTLNSIILYILISFLSLSSLFSSITGHALRIKLPPGIAWAFLCIFQACITFGIEETIRDGFKPLENTRSTSHEKWLKRTLLFIGIYEQMMFWRRKLVKPVVDDTIYQEERKELGIDSLMMGVTFTALWLWLLQREVEPLVLAAGRGGLRKAVGWSGFILWLVTFASQMTGFVRSVELLVWLVNILLQVMHCRVEQETDGLTPGANDV